jgi:hypothetical protein
MSSKACSADNVIGSLLGMGEYNGNPVGFEAVDELDNGGKATYVDQKNKIGQAIDAESAPTTPEQQAKADADKQAKEATNGWLGDAKTIVPGILQDVRNPSGVLGEDFIKPVVDFITDHHAEHFDDLKAGRSDYMDGIRDVFDDLDVASDSLSDAQNAYYKKYKSFYLDGGELYNLNSRSGLEKAVSNLGGNVIKSSPNVIIGNVLEGAIKLPTLYGKTFMQGMAKAAENGLFKKIPELEAKGVYGVNYAGESLGKWEGLIGVTDVPLKNIAYYSDLLAGGDGIKGVQKIAFTPRFGDLPTIYHSGGGRAATQFLGYTINTYKMYASLWQEAKRGNIQPLVTYHLMAGLLGGAGASVPAIGEGVWTSLFPDSAEWFEENKNPLAKLIQPGNISRIGVGFDIANRQGQRTVSNSQSGIEKLQDGDIKGGMLDLVDAGLSAMAFTSSPVGDLNLQKVLRIAKDVANEEIELEEVPEQAVDDFLPFLKEAQ